VLKQGPSDTLAAQCRVHQQRFEVRAGLVLPVGQFQQEAASDGAVWSASQPGFARSSVPAAGQPEPEHLERHPRSGRIVSPLSGHIRLVAGQYHVGVGEIESFHLHLAS
jgi:hypothetical protein